MANKHRLILIIILLVATVLRLITINQSLWLDEAISAQVIRSYTFSYIITQFAPADFHPPLYYLILKVWADMFGSSEFGLRSLSVLWGVVSVWLIAQIATKLFSKTHGIVAALLLACAPLHVYYSQEARMYTMETGLTLLAVLFFVNLIHQQTKRMWLLFTASMILLVYTDYLPWTMIGVFTVFLGLLLKSLRKDFLQWFMVSMATIGLAFVPFLPIFQMQLTLGSTATNSAWSQILGSLSPKSIGLLITKFLIGRISFDNKVVYAAYVAIQGFIAGGLVVYSIFTNYLNRLQVRKSAEGRILSNNWPLVLLMLWLTVPIVFGALLALKLSVFDYFRFLFVLPALYVLMTVGILSINRRFVRLTILAIVIGFQLLSLGIYYLNPRFHREDWRAAVAYIETNSGPDAVTLFVNPQQGDGYKYYSAGFVPFGGPELLSQRPKTVWLMRYVQDIFDPQDSVRKSIELAGYQKQAELDFNRVIFWKYIQQ